MFSAVALGNFFLLFRTVSEGGAIRVVADCLIFILSICALFVHSLFSVFYCALALFDRVIGSVGLMRLFGLHKTWLAV